MPTRRGDKGLIRRLRRLPGRAVPRDTTNKLRADAVSDREQEHGKEDRLYLSRDLNVQLSNQDADEQRSRD